MAWIAVLERLNVAGLLATAGTEPLVVEWGYPPQRQTVDRVRQLVAVGFNCWWFDADEGAALEAWKRAWSVTTTAEELAFHVQIGRIKQAWPEMARIYGSKVLRVLDAGPPPTRMAPEAISAALGLQ
jgi:hypothetical protein